MILTAKRASVLLALVISARATSFLFSKICLDTMNTFSLLALRFSVASIILFSLFHKRIFKSANKYNIISGIIIGSVFYFVLVTEHVGLKTTPASTAAFIENLAIVIAPLLECILIKKLPVKKNVISAFLAVSGVGMLTMNGNSFSFTSGELYLFSAALLYAIAIIVTARLTKQGDSFNIGFFQVITTGVLSWINVFLSGEFTMPQLPSQYGMILVLAIVCTCFGFTLQPVAQSKLSAETASSFCALSPLVASILSVIILRECLTLLKVAGGLLILLSLV